MDWATRQQGNKATTRRRNDATTQRRNNSPFPGDDLAVVGWRTNSAPIWSWLPVYPPFFNTKSKLNWSRIVQQNVFLVSPPRHFVQHRLSQVSLLSVACSASVSLFWANAKQLREEPRLLNAEREREREQFTSRSASQLSLRTKISSKIELISLCTSFLSNKIRRARGPACVHLLFAFSTPATTAAANALVNEQLSGEH